MMRRSVMLGTALIVAGGTVFLRGLSAPEDYEAPSPTEVSGSAQEGSPIIPWATGLAVLAGLALLTTGTRRKT